jgi:hypothetical protein
LSDVALDRRARMFRQLSTRVRNGSSLGIQDIHRRPNVEDRRWARFTKLPSLRLFLVENM